MTPDWVGGRLFWVATVMGKEGLTMELNRRWITHSRQGQAMTGYLVTPAMVKSPLPVILVIREIWGPDEHIQDVAERYAAAGYVTLAPDLYSRGGRPEPLSPARIEELKSFMNTVPPAAWHDQGLMQAAIQKEPADKAQRIQETMGVLFGGQRDMDAMVRI
jgi:carboxymethylenebutenolidase